MVMLMGRPKGNPKKPLFVRLDPVIEKGIRRYAEGHGMTISAAVERACEELLNGNFERRSAYKLFERELRTHIEYVSNVLTRDELLWMMADVNVDPRADVLKRWLQRFAVRNSFKIAEQFGRYTFSRPASARGAEVSPTDKPRR